MGIQGRMELSISHALQDIEVLRSINSMHPQQIQQFAANFNYEEEDRIEQ